MHIQTFLLVSGILLLPAQLLSIPISNANGSIENCGDRNFKGTWLVEIGPRRSSSFCYGVLVSERHILTSRDCQKMAIHSELQATLRSRRLRLPVESNISLPSPTDEGSVAIFTLTEPLDLVTTGVRPICLRSKLERIFTVEDHCLDLPVLSKASPHLFCLEAASNKDKCAGDDEPLRPGFPLYGIEKSGAYVLLGLGIANTCQRWDRPVYANVTAQTDWVLNQVESFYKVEHWVNNLCPIAGNDTVGLYCVQRGQFPGVITTTTRARCSAWEVDDRASFVGKDVVLKCAHKDYTIKLDRSKVKCLLDNCELAEKAYIPLDQLQNECTERTKVCSNDDVDLRTDGLVVSSQNGQQEGDQDYDGQSIFFNVNSDNDNKEEEDYEEQEELMKADEKNNSSITSSQGSAAAEDRLVTSTCATKLEGQSCHFPFQYGGRLRYECVTRNESSAGKPECPTAPAPKRASIVDWAECSESCPLMRYHDHNGLVAALKSMAQSSPHATTFTLGKSILGAELMGIRLKDSSDDKLKLKPMVKLIGNMHGNEPTGREMLIHLAQYILSSATNPDPDAFGMRAKRLLKTTDLWLLPTMNPDGFSRGTEGRCLGGNYSAGRYNEGRKDLNRDFPTWRELGQSQSKLKRNRQRETVLVMTWILKHPFVLSANFHDGAILANYPYDDYRDDSPHVGVSKTADHDVFYHLATTYSKNHAYMLNTTVECPYWGHFEDGVTNGAEWYEVSGGMQDFNYVFTNAMELTIEVSCCKYPSRERLLVEWENNLDSLLSFIEQAQRGIKGTVVDVNGNGVEHAHVLVRKLGSDIFWRKKRVITASGGRFWRILMPGQYKVKATNATHQSRELGVTIKDILEPVVLRLTLEEKIEIPDKAEGSAVLFPNSTFSPKG